MSEIYIVTAVDYGESCDGKAHVIGAYKNKDEACNVVQNEMQNMLDNLAGMNVVANFDEMSIVNSCDDLICIWNIEGVEVK